MVQSYGTYPDPGSERFFDPWIRFPEWGKNGTGSAIRNDYRIIPDYFSESLETVFRAKNT